MKKLFSLMAIALMLSLVLTACGGPAATPEAPAIEAPFPYLPGGALEEALKGTYGGTTVTVDGAMEGNDPDGV
jgi:ABC-type glycerol-3-phosphate transport system substrate-binding protein